MSSARITCEAAQTTSATMISQPNTAMAVSRRRAQRSLAAEGARGSRDCGTVVSIAIHPERGAACILAGSAVSPRVWHSIATGGPVRREETASTTTEDTEETEEEGGEGATRMNTEERRKGRFTEERGGKGDAESAGYRIAL